MPTQHIQVLSRMNVRLLLSNSFIEILSVRIYYDILNNIETLLHLHCFINYKYHTCTVLTQMYIIKISIGLRTYWPGFLPCVHGKTGWSEGETISEQWQFICLQPGNLIKSALIWFYILQCRIFFCYLFCYSCSRDGNLWKASWGVGQFVGLPSGSEVQHIQVWL